MNERPLRLLWFNLVTDADAPNLGFTTEWLNALAPHCERIDVITMRAGRIAVAHNVQVYSLGAELDYSEPRRALKFYRLLLPLLRRHDYDACFAHMQPLFAVMSAPLLRLYKVPLTLWYTHRSVTLRLRLAERAATRVVSASPESFRLPSDKLCVIGHGIDTQRFTPAPPPPGPFTILSLGRIAPVKHLETIIAATQLLQAQRLDFRLRLVGQAYPQDRAYAQMLRLQVEESGLQARVEFAGSVAREQVPSELQRAHVMVNMSATGSLDKAVLEAMACGLPVVTANEAFVPLLAPWREQLLTPPDDPEALAQRIRAQMTLDDDERAALGIALRALVQREHSMQRLVAQLLAVLRSGEPLA